MPSTRRDPRRITIGSAVFGVRLLDDPVLGCVGLDSTSDGHLCDEQLARRSVELVGDRRGASFGTLAFSLCAVADDLGEPADRAVRKLGLRISVAPRPM